MEKKGIEYRVLVWKPTWIVILAKYWKTYAQKVG